MNERILIIEDDPDIAESVSYNLRREGFRTEIAESGEKGFRLAIEGKSPPAVIVLDLMLPGMNGTELCRRFRRDSVTAKTPIIILTAKASESDKITGLELGADDYVTKPFSVKELMARVNAVLRRANEDTATKYEDDKILIEYDEKRVTCCGAPVKLTRKEFDLLATLAKNADHVATRHKLLDGIWGYDYYGDTRTLDVHIRRLRQKLGGCSDYIETVVGTGYRFLSSK